LVVDKDKITETENINIVEIKFKEDAVIEIIDLLGKFLHLYYLLYTLNIIYFMF